MNQQTGFKSGDMIKGLVTSMVDDANEQDKANAQVANASARHQEIVEKSIEERAASTPLASGSARFATSFPMINMSMPDGVRLTFRGGTLDVDNEEYIKYMRAAIKAGNHQIWEVEVKAPQTTPFKK